MSGTRLMSIATTRGLCCDTSALICSPTYWALTKKSRPSGRTISRPSKVSSSGCSGDSGRSTSAPRLRPMTDTRGCAVWLARLISDRMIATTMPLSVPSSEHADAGDQRPAEFHRAHGADGTELGRLDQSDRIDNDDRRERGVRHQAEHRCQQQHRRHRGACGHQRRLLRPPARGAHDGRLRRAASGRHRAEQRTAHIGGPRGDQFAIRVDRRVVGAGKRASRGDRFGEAHERDPERARQQLHDQRGIRAA